VKTKRGNTALHLAINESTEAIALQIIAAGCDVRTTGPESETPLFMAIKK
jgi:ankyrin repeat protein